MLLFPPCCVFHIVSLDAAANLVLNLGSVSCLVADTLQRGANSPPGPVTNSIQLINVRSCKSSCKEQKLSFGLHKHDRIISKNLILLTADASFHICICCTVADGLVHSSNSGFAEGHLGAQT